MARVNRTGIRRADTRGQLLLLTGIGLAVLLVLLALVLNTAIYTENAATSRTGGQDILDGVRYQYTAVETTEALLDVTNRPGDTDYATMERDLRTQLGSWSNLSAQHVARNGAVVSVTLNSTVRGTHIVQASDRSLTNAPGEANWTLFDGATEIGRFTSTVEPLVTVSNPSPSETNLTERQVFWIEFANASGSSRVYVYDRGGTTIQTVDSGGHTDTCSSSAPTAGIDFVAGTMNGTDCPGLDGLTTLDDLTVSFGNGQNANGTYDLVVDRDAMDGDLEDPLLGNRTGPYGERIIYAASFDVRYTTPSYTFDNRDVHVSGGDWP